MIYFYFVEDKCMFYNFFKNNDKRPYVENSENAKIGHLN